MSNALISAVKENNRQATADILRKRSILESPSHFREYLADVATAVEIDNWDKIPQHWLDDHFIDDRGNVLLCANYIRRINGEDITELTLLEGKICGYVPVTMETAAIGVFGVLNQEIPKLLVLDVEIAVGNIGNEEAFIAPGGWTL
jgi:hypothetical protein